MRRVLFAAIAATLLLAFGWSASRAGATVMVEVSLEDMILGSDAIVHGVVDRTGMAWEIRNGTRDPWTVSRLRVLRWLKNGDGAPTVSIRELGAVWQGGGRWIDGTPTYDRGEEVIVFLRRVDNGWRTFAMVQGKFVVRHGVPGVPDSVRRDTSGIAFARWAQGEMVVTPGGQEPAMELETFVDYVRIVLGGAP
jgi:hypothetical protein